MNNRSKSTSIYLLIAIMWSLITLYLSIMPSDNVKSISAFYFKGIDKVAHLILYMMFSFLWYKALSYILAKNVIWITLIISILFGIAMEVLQLLFFSDRSFEYPDIIANIIGSFIGVIFLKRIKF